MKIVSIVGARPQFIKVAMIDKELAKHKHVRHIVIHTGQHYDTNMSEIFFKQMDIPKPAFNLNIHGLSHGAMTGQMLQKLEPILMNIKPDMVLVYGDTNSTLAGALAAKKLNYRVAHIESGLRSFNMAMPEEINRMVVDRISNICFCPTKRMADSLPQENGVVSGDIMLDALLHYSKEIKPSLTLPKGLKDFALCTIHREANLQIEVLTKLVNAINKVNEIIPVVMPLHPRTQAVIASNALELKCKFINPVGYFDMLELTRHSKFVLTDSGGLQKEAYYFRKYCVVLREETEWVDLVENAQCVLVGCDEETILNAAKNLQQPIENYVPNIYGNGNASKIIVDTILN